MRHHTHPPDSLERQRGVLTPTDRGFYLDPSAYDDAQARNIRSKARKRIFDSILDFTILINHLPERDINQLFGEFSDDEQQARTHLNSGVIDALAFLYFTDSTSFSHRLERAIRRARIRAGSLTDVNVDIEVEETATLHEVKERVSETGIVYSDEYDLLDYHDAVPIRVRKLPGSRSDHYGIPDDVDDPYEKIKYVLLPSVPDGADDDLDERHDEVQRALRTVYDYLQQREEATDADERDPTTVAQEVADNFYHIYPLGFDDPADWWTDLMAPLLSRIDADVPWLNQTLVDETDETDDENEN